MRFIKNARSVPKENDDTSDAVLVARCSNVVFEEPYILRGDYSIYNATTIIVKKHIKRSEELLIDYSADYNF